MMPRGKAGKIHKGPKKGAKRAKKILSPQEIEQRKQKQAVRSLFAKLGFARIKTDGKEFTFKGRTGEFDDAFVYENILVMAEYTVAASTGEHVAKKSILYNKINGDEQGWIEFAGSLFPELAEHLSQADYDYEDYRVFICYFSTTSVSDEYESALQKVRFLNGTRLRYFRSLVHAIQQSARHEFFSYLGLEHSEIGENIKSTTSSSKTFGAQLLPAKFSSFPAGFKVVSFYADPATLLMLAYVLRRDSWRDPEGMYQRVIQRSRMNQMRRYLTTEQRVFVNNLVVTLPSDVVLNDPESPGKNLAPKGLTTVRNVNLVIPERYNTVGIVDGQHRVFCYHEGMDKYEAAIRPLRDRQNLLATGIVYPEDYSDTQKRRFEAKLFLEINDKQKRTNSDLKHSIEVILNPYSTISIAKAVINRLNASGPLKGMLQTNYFDPPNLIRTTSIVSYGLRPLLKLDGGGGTLFDVWTNSQKSRLRELQRSKNESDDIDPILDQYIAYAAKAINNFLVGAKRGDESSRWNLTPKAADRYLTPTIINGFAVCLRLLAQGGKLPDMATYESRFKGLNNFNFKKYKSSNWGVLGRDMHKRFFQ